jgi:hypothetical protein
MTCLTRLTSRLTLALVLGPLLAGGAGCLEARLTIRHQDPAAGSLVVDVDGGQAFELAPGATVALSRPPGQCQIDVMEPATGRHRVLSLWVDGAIEVDVVPLVDANDAVGGP